MIEFLCLVFETNGVDETLITPTNTQKQPFADLLQNRCS